MTVQQAYRSTGKTDSSIRTSIPEAPDILAFETPQARSGKTSKAAKTRRKQALLLYGSAAVLLLVLIPASLLLYLDPFAKPALPTEAVTRGTFTNTVSVNGTLQAREQAAITNAPNGTISAVWVNEGDTVSEDQGLFEVEVTTPGRAKSHESVTAPISGQVAQLNLSVGRSFAEQSSATSPALVIADLSSMEIALDVNEVDIPHIAVGQTATLSFDAIADLTLTAAVTHVSTLPNEGAAAQGLAPGGAVVTYPVQLVLEGSDPRLKPGMSVSARITVNEVPDVLLVNALAIQELDGSSVVYVQEPSGDIVAVEVNVIASSPTQVAIEGELAEGEQVLIGTSGMEQGGRSDLFGVRSRFNG
ncbi:MAG: efflux RND transporter periplasmic adaptor subunit [Coriobacteriales bacterium]|jgi:multidrug efflux pump subunit AcrA (membrane-fusion protein)|nr:efflux RND transporter periplasmic adaptor subunit [Coriobacteriales bacterium]